MAATDASLRHGTLRFGFTPDAEAAAVQDSIIQVSSSAISFSLKFVQALVDLRVQNSSSWTALEAAAKKANQDPYEYALNFDKTAANAQDSKARIAAVQSHIESLAEKASSGFRSALPSVDEYNKQQDAKADLEIQALKAREQAVLQGLKQVL